MIREKCYNRDFRGDTFYPTIVEYFDRLQTYCKQLNPYFENKKIFIVGYDGFLGSWFYNYFRYLNNAHGLNITLYGGDLSNNFNILDEKEVNCTAYKDCDIIINCAGSGDSFRGSTEEVIKLGILGYNNLLKHKRTDAKFLQFGPIIDWELPEYLWDLMKQMKNLYSNVLTVKSSPVIGPGMDLHTSRLFNKVLNKQVDGEPIDIFMLSEEKFTLAHVLDVLLQSLHIIAYGKDSIYQYNIGNDAVTDLPTLYKNVSIEAKEECWESVEEFNIDSLYHTRIDFNIEPLFTPEEAFRDTLSYYKSLCKKSV